jgi:dihydrofolate reductase
VGTRGDDGEFDVAKLIYSVIASLDGCVEDKRGNFDWGEPDEEVLAFVNELERPIGTSLYGRRMYETLVYWETNGDGADQSLASREFALLWRTAEKIVYSRTLPTASSTRTRIERDFDPTAIRRLKESSTRDLSVGGAELAGVAMAAGLVDEIHLLLCPVVVGGGKRALPDDVLVELDLLDEQRFGSGVVHLHYGVRGGTS